MTTGVYIQKFVGTKAVKINDELMTREPVKLGPQHAPMAHASFYRVVHNQLKQLGLPVQSTVHSVSASGDQYFGIAILEPNTQFSPIMAWRCAHNQRTRITVHIGAGFDEIDSMCFFGEIPIPVRQSFGYADKLPQLMQDALCDCSNLTRQHVATVRTFKQTTITQAEAEQAIVGMIRDGVINTRRIERVIDQWDSPDAEGCSKSTLWRLFCAVADSYKPLTGKDSISTLIHRSPRLMLHCSDMLWARG